MQPETQIQTTAPPALWRIARAFICVLHDLFGDPSDIARAHTLTRAAYKLLLSWLRVGEAMMRRLIAIEAAAFPAAPIAERTRTKRKRVRRLMEFWPEKPDEWRVYFRCSASAPRMLRQAQHDASEPHDKTPLPKSVTLSLSKGDAKAPLLHNAWPIAERYEALIRAFNDPLRYARRLARRLHAHPQTLDALLKAPPEYEHRVDHADAFTSTAERAWPQRRDSS